MVWGGGFLKLQKVEGGCGILEVKRVRRCAGGWWWGA